MARGGRIATSAILSCKHDLIAQNIDSSFVMKTQVICTGVRICYAVSEPFVQNTTAFKETLLTCIERGLTFLEMMYPGCAYKHIPREEKYFLHSLQYFHNFVSG
ncbi:uncharacterized protein LOC135375530 isoform X2 [Ornithodoros turicata]|uniref:uncharacterized protein LOC135375530 isoform X2 n=1 Tax=Ornithodoros turicata TaxID=34597 RepID=UPI00313945D3